MQSKISKATLLLALCLVTGVLSWQFPSVDSVPPTQNFGYVPEGLDDAVSEMMMMDGNRTSRVNRTRSSGNSTRSYSRVNRTHTPTQEIDSEKYGFISSLHSNEQKKNQALATSYSSKTESQKNYINMLKGDLYQRFDDAVLNLQDRR